MIRNFLSSLLAVAAVSLPGAAWSQFAVNDGTNRGTCNSFSFASGTLSLSPSGCLAGTGTTGPVFSFATTNPTSISESYAAGVANRPATFGVHLERNGNASALSVDVEVCPPATGCTAIGGLDFQLDASYPPSSPFRKTLTFAPGETDRTFDVHIVDDALQDGNKTLTFGLSSAAAPATISGATGGVTLVDDDAPSSSGTVAWALSAFGVSEADAAGIAALPITRSSGTGSATVQVEIPVAGTTAIVGSHYNINNATTPFTGNPPTTTVTFANGATTGYVFLPIVNNPVVETSKTVALNLKNPVGLTLAAPASTVLTINDAGGAGVDLDINGALIPSPTGPVNATMCEVPGNAPSPGSGPGPCGSYQIPLGNCSSGMTGANAINKAWLYVLEDLYPGGPRLGNGMRLGIPRDAAMIFRFKTGPASAFAEKFASFGHADLVFSYEEQFNRGAAAPHFVSISESKCDFDYGQTYLNLAPSYNGCYVTMSSSGGMLARVWPAGSQPTPTADAPNCPLKPDTTYYLNIRYEDASTVGSRGQLSCPTATCGAAINPNF